MRVDDCPVIDTILLLHQEIFLCWSDDLTFSMCFYAVLYLIEIIGSKSKSLFTAIPPSTCC